MRIQLSTTVTVCLVFCPKIHAILRGQGENYEFRDRPDAQIPLNINGGPVSSDDVIDVYQENEDLKVCFPQLWPIEYLSLWACCSTGWNSEAGFPDWMDEDCSHEYGQSSSQTQTFRCSVSSGCFLLSAEPDTALAEETLFRCDGSHSTTPFFGCRISKWTCIT